MATADPLDFRAYSTTTQALLLIISKLESYGAADEKEKKAIVAHVMFEVMVANDGSPGPVKERRAIKEIYDQAFVILEDVENFPDKRVLGIARRGLVPDDTCECRDG